jgi:glycosyltransferase involved in cell wall biosynthesis
MMLILEDPHIPATKFCEMLDSAHVQAECIPIRNHLDFSCLTALRRKLGELNPTIVHTHLLHGDLYGLQAAKDAKVPIRVSSRHNNDRFRRNWFVKQINRMSMRNAHQVVAISEAVAQFVRDVEGIPATKVEVILYGLEAPSAELRQSARRKAREELQYQQEDVVIGFFGRLVQQKGVDVLLGATRQVVRRHSGVKLLIVGDGSERDTLTCQVADHGLQEVVQFTGWVEQAQRLMPACDLIVVPSRWEGFGLVTLEVMGWALPLIASRTSSLPEIVVEGETGILVPPEDQSALANAIGDLLDNPDIRQTYGLAGYQRLLEIFSVDRMVSATTHLYQSLIAEQGSH